MFDMGFLNFPDFFLTNVKFPLPTEQTISQIIPENGLNPSLTVILPTHLHKPVYNGHPWEMAR